MRHIGHFLRTVAAASLLGALAAPPSAATNCGDTAFCTVEGGRYLALPPPNWDGRAPLPATIFFHGWRSSAEDFATNPAFTGAFATEGVLLVLPDALAGTWAHGGSPSTRRDELAFMDAVRADLLTRWRVDPERLLVTGFSQGGSMVWDLACHRGGAYRAFAAVSGAFWEPLPERCEGGPVDLLHIHGTADPVVPMAGRAIRDTWRQGDVEQGLAVLRAADACADATRPEPMAAGLSCEVWDACGSGRELRLCRHGDGHVMPDGWVSLAHDWLDRLIEESGG